MSPREIDERMSKPVADSRNCVFGFIKIAAIVFIFISPDNQCFGVLRVPGMRNRKHFAYVREGDINIGQLVSIHYADSTQIGRCSQRLKARAVLRYKAMVYAVDQINSRHDLLPNVTLGFVQFDDCSSDLTALNAAVYMVQDDNDVMSGAGTCRPLTWNSSVDGGIYPRSFDVVGVVGPSDTTPSATVSKYLGTFGIPVMATYATSNTLSDKTQFPYFMRIVITDLAEERTLIEIAYRMGWTYVSMVYSAGTYGDGAYSDVQSLLRTTAASYGICLAVIARIPSGATRLDYEHAVKQLASEPAARVVLTYLQTTDQPGLFDATRQTVGTGWFLWLASDSLYGNENSEYIDVLEGSLYANPPTGVIDGFQEYVWSLSYNSSIAYSNHQTTECDREDDEYWFRQLWKSQFSCVDDSENVTSSTMSYPRCNSFRSLNQSSAPFDWYWSITSRVYDAVYVYAHAVHDVISDRCPQLFLSNVSSTELRTALIRNCLDRATVLAYLKKVRFKGVIGEIEFDSNGDMAGDVLVYQYQRQRSVGGSTSFVSKQVATWSIGSITLTLLEDVLRWTAFNQTELQESRLIQQGPIASICSRPCNADEYVIQLAVACCWRCERCRENEIVDVNGTSCSACPQFTWPSVVDATVIRNRSSGPVISMVCLPIPPTVLKASDPLAVVLVVLASCNAAISVTVGIVYVVKRHHRLIKATSRELSSIILTGTLLAIATTISYVLWPTDRICTFRSIGFHLAVNILYAPLLMKTLRTYRIFASAKHGVRMPAFVSGKSQIVFTSEVIAIQVILLVISELIDRSAAVLNQPASYVNYVELFCRKSVTWFLVPLAYNMALMVGCVVLGFKARHLPENFNDSQFIFASVATTLFVWILFVPAYFTAYYAYLRSAIIGFCLVSNVSVTLVCQFVRIAYAVFFVPTDRIKFNMADLTVQTAPEPSAAGAAAALGDRNPTKAIPNSIVSVT